MTADRNHPPLQAVLFDLDGVLYIGNNPIEGAAESVQTIKDMGLSVAGVTNTTTQPRRVIAEKLAALGIPIAASEIFTPAALAVQTIGQKKARLFIRDALQEDFKQCQREQTEPDYIVMGDIGGEGYPPELLLEIFRHIMAGSKLLALHKNRFWQKQDGLYLDLGTFVSAMEYATGQQAVVLGKPSAAFFHGVCKALHVQPEQAMMVGDDIESDIHGAMQAGLGATLVKTGKYREEFVRFTGINADLTLDSVAYLPDTLGALQWPFYS